GCATRRQVRPRSSPLAPLPPPTRPGLLPTRARTRSTSTRPVHTRPARIILDRRTLAPTRPGRRQLLRRDRGHPPRAGTCPPGPAPPSRAVTGGRRAPSAAVCPLPPVR